MLMVFLTISGSWVQRRRQYNEVKNEGSLIRVNHRKDLTSHLCDQAVIGDFLLKINYAYF